MRTGGFEYRHLCARAAGRLSARTLGILLVCLVATAVIGGAASAATYQLDSLSYESDDTMLYISFLLPMELLNSAEFQAALDDNGLTIECSISIEVHRSQKFGGEVVSKKPILRTMRYSKWYNEYILTEGAKEILTSASYYETMSRFRRFSAIPVIELCFLDPERNHRISLELVVRGGAPVQERGGGGAALAGIVPAEQGKAFADIAKLWRKKGGFLSLALQSKEFSIETLDRLPAPRRR